MKGEGKCTKCASRYMNTIRLEIKSKQKKSIVGQKLSAKYGYHKEKSKQNQYWKNNDFTKSEDTWSADICTFLSRIRFYKGKVEKGQLRSFFKRFWQIFKKDWHLNWPSSICIIFQRNIHSSFFISSVPHREQKESRWLEKVEEYTASIWYWWRQEDHTLSWSDGSSGDV